MTNVWHGMACRHGAPLQRIDRLRDIAWHASSGMPPRVVCRRLAEAGRSPAPAPAFMFGGAGAGTARALFSQIDVPACGCFALDDAAVAPEGLVIKACNGFCGETIGVPMEAAAGIVQRLNTRSVTTRHVGGTIVPLFGGTACSAAGLVTEVLPGLWTLAAAGYRLDELLIAVPDDLPDEGRAMLRAAGVQEWQCLPAGRDDDVIRAGRVVVPSRLQSGARFSPLMQQATGFWTGKLRHSLGLPEPRPGRRLFLSPRETAEPSGIADWQATEAAATEQGMEVVHPAWLGLAERACLFGEADCLLGFDGAALMEACAYAPPGIWVCVIRGSLVRGAGTAALALALGHQVGVVFGTADQEDPLAPALVEAEDRQNALACLALGGRPVV